MNEVCLGSLYSAKCIVKLLWKSAQKTGKHKLVESPRSINEKMTAHSQTAAHTGPAPNIITKVHRALLRSSFTQKSIKTAQSIFGSLLSKICFMHRLVIRTLKALASIFGCRVGYVVRGERPLAQSEKVIIESCLRRNSVAIWPDSCRG